MLHSPVGFPVTRGPRVIHVLMWDGRPIAAAERLERLAMQMSAYTPAQQALMDIIAVELFE